MPTAGTYDLLARVASQYTGGTFRVLLDGVTKATINVPATGGFNTWTTVYKTGISLPSGRHTVMIAMDKVGLNSIVGNINWLKFNASTATTTTTTAPTSLTVQAESATTLGGITRGTTNLANVDAGDWAQFKGLNFGAGVKNIGIKIAVAAINAGHQIQIRQGSVTGKILGTLTVQDTGGYGVFKEQAVPISFISGTQDIYLTFSGGYGVGNIDSLRFW